MDMQNHTTLPRVTFRQPSTEAGACARSQVPTRRLFATLLVLLTTMSFVLMPDSAHADETGYRRDHHLLGGSAELYFSHLVDEDGRKNFGPGLGGGLYLELNLVSWLGIQVGGLGNWYSKKDADETTYNVGLSAGLRLHWGEWIFDGDSNDDLWADIHFNYSKAEDLRVAGFDAGLGYEFGLNDKGTVRLGPMVRVMWLRGPNEQDLGNKPIAFNVGLSMGFGGRHRVEEKQETLPEGPKDQDGDGVVDSEDYCPTEPQGADPDPERPGCPRVVRDQDGDGVPDGEDKCPTVSAGANPDPDRPGCPIIDTDGDGVPDDKDECPSVHQGPRADPNRPGCPITDRDGDTVLDDVDACPDEPGAPNKDPKLNGCPSLVRVKGARIEIDKPVYFATNKDRILEASFPVLRAVADALIASEVIGGVRIEGHTDSRGRDSYNLELSERRAQSVRTALVKLGVPSDKLTARGYGEEKPVESNNTRAGRAANRRVEFHITSRNDGGETSPGDSTGDAEASGSVGAEASAGGSVSGSVEGSATSGRTKKK